MKKIIISILSVFIVFFMTGCTDKQVLQYKNLYEEEAFKNIQTNKEKVEVLNTRLMETIFSIDKNESKEKVSLQMIKLYSIDDFYNKFKNVVYPQLKTINERTFGTCKTVNVAPGFITYKEKETEAYIVTSDVSYRQNQTDVTKTYDVLFLIDENGAIKISDLLEVDKKIENKGETKDEQKPIDKNKAEDRPISKRQN